MIDCVSVSGNTAWVSATITDGTFGDFDLAGFDVVTMVQDNGTSANDPPDKISPSFIGFGLPCDLQPDLGLPGRTRGAGSGPIATNPSSPAPSRCGWAPG